jgi:cyclopropane-fatty-acyl-phospholipid synthase
MHRHFTRKVRRHYEIDAELYEMILDEEMFYTCAFFEDEHLTLAEAQQNKIATAISRMDLPSYRPRVLDIGCGWGAAERALVRRHPSVEVCGLSISANQIHWALQKDVRSLNGQQAARIEYRLEDYERHDRPGYYDCICVLGMLEHVGLGGYPAFFAQIERLLKPGGTALIHTIVCPVAGSPTNRWIDKHIFTGGYAPSVSELVTAIESHPLRVSNIHLHGPANYRRTIEAWAANLAANIERMKTYLKGENLSDLEAEKILLTWQFYLSAVWNMFDECTPQAHQVAHVCIKKP